MADIVRDILDMGLAVELNSHSVNLAEVMTECQEAELTAEEVSGEERSIEGDRPHRPAPAPG